MGIIEVYGILAAENSFFLSLFPEHPSAKASLDPPVVLQGKTPFGAATALTSRVTLVCEEASEILRTSCLLNLEKGNGFHIFFPSVMC